MGQISSLDLDLEGFQTALDSFYNTLRQTSPTTPETIAKLEEYADAVDQDLDKCIEYLERRSSKSKAEENLDERVNAVIKDLDLAYTIVRNGVQEEWEVRWQDGLLHVYNAHGKLLIFYYVGEDRDEAIVEEGGEVDWVVASDSFDVTTMQPLAKRPPDGWIGQCN